MPLILSKSIRAPVKDHKEQQTKRKTENGEIKMSLITENMIVYRKIQENLKTSYTINESILQGPTWKLYINQFYSYVWKTVNTMTFFFTITIATTKKIR